MTKEQYEQYRDLQDLMYMNFDLICTLEELDLIIQFAIKVAEKQEKVIVK